MEYVFLLNKGVQPDFITTWGTEWGIGKKNSKMTNYYNLLASLPLFRFNIDSCIAQEGVA